MQVCCASPQSVTYGSSKHDTFCERFEVVVLDTSLTVPQKDPLNIIEPWKKVCMIDEDLLVCFAVDAHCSFNFVQSNLRIFCKHGVN